MSSYESDSDAPDDVSFSTGREHALREFGITKHERERQDNSKEWRKKRDALYKEQKEQKVLSMSVLTKAENELNEKHTSAKKHKQYEEERANSDAGFSDVDSSEEEPDVEKQDPVLDENECGSESDEGSPRITIKVLDKTEQKSMLQAALDFKANALYGKGIKRLSMAEYRQQRKKIRAGNKKPHNFHHSTRKSKRSEMHEGKSQRSRVRKCA